MKLGIRARLFAVSVGLIMVLGLGAERCLESEVRDATEDRIAGELKRQAGAIAEALPDEPAAIAPLVSRLGEVTGLQVTVIGPGGAVLGDSHLPPDRAGAEAGRPEVRRALDDGEVGRHQRYGTALGSEAAYVAIPHDLGGGRGAVRVGGSLAPADAAIDRLRTMMLVAGAVGLLVAVLMSNLAAGLLLRTLRTMVRAARNIAAGERHRRVEVPGGEELGGLAGSLNRMAEELEITVAALVEERARFQEVLEGMGEAVAVLDEERRVVLLNPAAATLLGLGDGAVGQPLIEHVRAPALQELVAAPGEPRTAEIALPGTPRQLLATVSPRRAAGGCILVVHDVTEIRRLERVRRDFVANVSHELRTPVSVIRANTETLVDGALDDPEAARRLLDALYRNAERLSRIIDDLLDLSRLESGRYALDPQRVPVAEACREAVSAVEGKAAGKGIHVSLEVSGELALRADPKALDQILVNLLDNAVKYTPEGGRVGLSATARDERVHLAVSDDGPGIGPNHRDRIFERFYRIDPGRSRAMGGTGLGLSIVKHLAEAMDGAVGVEPARPQGSIFWITLPRA